MSENQKKIYRMKKEAQLDSDKIKKLTDEVTDMLLKKNKDYGSASFDLGLNGNMVHIWDKAKRYRTLVEKQILQQGEIPNFESISDTLKDIIGYAIIGLIILETDIHNTTSS